MHFNLHLACTVVCCVEAAAAAQAEQRNSLSGGGPYRACLRQTSGKTDKRLHMHHQMGRHHRYYRDQLHQTARSVCSAIWPLTASYPAPHPRDARDGTRAPLQRRPPRPPNEASLAGICRMSVTLPHVGGAVLSPRTVLVLMLLPARLRWHARLRPSRRLVRRLNRPFLLVLI